MKSFTQKLPKAAQKGGFLDMLHIIWLVLFDKFSVMTMKNVLISCPECSIIIELDMR